MPHLIYNPIKNKYYLNNETYKFWIEDRKIPKKEAINLLKNLILSIKENKSFRDYLYKSRKFSKFNISINLLNKTAIKYQNFLKSHTFYVNYNYNNYDNWVIIHPNYKYMHSNSHMKKFFEMGLDVWRKNLWK
jgi:hypothetical protein